MNIKDKPFSRAYVISTTLRNMHKDIDFSLEKTVNRIKEFEGSLEKSSEVLRTLSDLHAMKAQIDEALITNSKEI